jgi:hypothetical protein
MIITLSLLFMLGFAAWCAFFSIVFFVQMLYEQQADWERGVSEGWRKSPRKKKEQADDRNS